MFSDPEDRPAVQPGQPDPVVLAADDRYNPAQDIGIRNLLPSQVDKGLRLEERQERTRSQLAMFLIKMLAGTLGISFALVILLILMSGFVDNKEKAESFDKTSALVKDLVTFILTAQTGLIGTALGFYFGSRGSNND
ncbi:MAG: hypothetical protein KGQ93_07070 [Cyanobacteria bacterium REEB459]|nr:hypothetical protein [Cyanobacteria bacterium REEB459]